MRIAGHESMASSDALIRKEIAGPADYIFSSL